MMHSRPETLDRPLCTLGFPEPQFGAAGQWVEQNGEWVLGQAQYRAGISKGQPVMDGEARSHPALGCPPCGPQ